MVNWNRDATDQEVCIAHSLFIALALYEGVDATVQGLYLWMLAFLTLAWSLWCRSGYGLLTRLLAVLLGLVDQQFGRRYMARAQCWRHRVDRGSRRMRVIARMGARWRRIALCITRRHWSPQRFRPGHRSRRGKGRRTGRASSGGANGDGPPDLVGQPLSHGPATPLLPAAELPGWFCSYPLCRQAMPHAN
ncbi:MAG: hypothetical protein C3F12_04380 [Candidatus Methylomirabilota bacterium]|nr:MAG: hypothetical protein C3F12_04380 [candidate division NC10 bacterium]